MPIRLILAGVLAVAVTGGLFALMTFLIHTDGKAPEEGEETRIVDITMPETTVEARYETPKPDKPEEPEQPPPDLPDVEIDTPDIDVGNLSVGAPVAQADLNVKGLGGFSGDGEYLPIVKVQPVYPRRALQRGIEGYVIVEFTVTKSGQVRDPVVVESDPPKIFDRAAVNAALKFKYKPRVVDGNPIEVPGVQNKITFAIAK